MNLCWRILEHPNNCFGASQQNWEICRNQKQKLKMQHCTLRWYLQPLYWYSKYIPQSLISFNLISTTPDFINPESRVVGDKHISVYTMTATNKRVHVIYTTDLAHHYLKCLCWNKMKSTAFIAITWILCWMWKGNNLLSRKVNRSFSSHYC